MKLKRRLREWYFANTKGIDKLNKAKEYALGGVTQTEAKGAEVAIVTAPISLVDFPPEKCIMGTEIEDTQYRYELEDQWFGED